jgi:hypothetical protein
MGLQISCSALIGVHEMHMQYEVGMLHVYGIWGGRCGYDMRYGVRGMRYGREIIIIICLGRFLKPIYCIAGNFRWCKISRNCMLALQKNFNFCTFSTPRPHPCQSIECMTSHVFSAHLRFHGSYFCGTQPIREKREILHHAKISHYMVHVP